MSSDLTPVSELSVYCSRAKIALPVFTFIDRPGSGFVDFQCFCVFFGKRFESKWFRNKQSAKQDVSKLILEDLPNLSVKTDRHTVSTTAISLMTDFYNNHRLKLPYLVVNQVCGLDGVRYNAVGHTVDGMVKYNCDFMTENDARNDMAGQLLKSAEHFVASRMKPSPLVTIYDVKRDYVAMIQEYCKRNDFLKFKVQYFETGSSGLRKFACEIKFSKLWVRSPYSFDNRTEAEQYCAFVCCHILKHLYGKVEAYAYFRSQPGDLPPQVYSKPSEIIINVLPLVPLDMSYSPFLVPRKEEENQVYVPVEKKSDDVKYTRCKFDLNDDWMWADMRSADVERTDLEKIVDVHSEEVQKLVVTPPEENTKVMAAMTVPVADEYREDVRFDNIEPIVYFDAPGRSIVPVRHYYRKRIPTSGDMMCGFDRRFWIRVLSFVDVKSLFRNCVRVCRYIYDVIKLREFWQYKKSNLKEGMFLQVRKFIEKFPVEAWCGIYLDYPMMANRDVICDFTIKQLKNLLARAGSVWSLTISRVVGFSSLDTRVKRMGIYSSVSHGIKCNVLYNDTGTPRWNNDLDRGADTGGKYLATRTIYPGRIMQLMIDLPNEPVMRRLIHKLFCCEGGGLEVFYSDEPYGYYYTVVAMYYSPLTANLIEIGCETYPPTLKGNFQYFGL